MTALANHWAQKGWDITLLTYEKPGTEPFYALNSRVKLVQIDVLSLNLFLRPLEVFIRILRFGG